MVIDYYTYSNGVEVLSSAFHVQALIWSKMSTGLPIEISSSMKGQGYTSFCRLDIDIHRYVVWT